MHERKKIEEAKYFYSKMIEEQIHREKFIYNLSAFLSSARSVLQYALKEAKIKEEGQKWYDNFISNSTISKFFKCKRDINIHTVPIKTQAHYKVELKDTVHISDSVSVILRDKDGDIKQQHSSGKPERLQYNKQQSPESIKIKYKFDDWAGTEDVLSLCQMYIQELEILIKDGVNKGVING